MEKVPTSEDLELFGHSTLAKDLLNAEYAMKSISLHMSSLRFVNDKKFKKQTLSKTEKLYSEIRILRESIGNEFQRLFKGWENCDTPRLHYAYRGETYKEIQELFSDVSCKLKKSVISYADDIPF
jgi:hypothetical protein